MVNKLDKLDVIEERLKTFENDMNDVKDSVEYAQAEIKDLKIERYLQKKPNNK